MSKLATVVVLSALITFAVMIGLSPQISSGMARVFSTSNANTQSAVGVRGSVVSPPDASYQPDSLYQFEGTGGHDCGSESYYNPADD